MDPSARVFPIFSLVTLTSKSMTGAFELTQHPLQEPLTFKLLQKLKSHYWFSHGLVHFVFILIKLLQIHRINFTVCWMFRLVLQRCCVAWFWATDA